ncbi:MAG: NAD-dependent epimerase/dehydratase family protein [Aureliella sp.]
MTTVLVTGYGGFLGAAVSRQLLSAGFSVRGLARGDYPQLQAEGVECIRGDVTDEDTIAAATEGIDAIVHTAAKAGVWGNWSDYYSINTAATESLLNAAKRNAIGAFVQTSSPSVTFGGEHQSGVDESAGYPSLWLCHYPHTKALAEKAVLDSASNQLRTCALRPHLIWGLGDPHLFPRVIQRAQAGRLRRVGNGQNLIDTVHVDVAAQAHVSAVTRLLDGDEAVNGEAFFLSDGQPLACWAWISQILDCAGVPVPEKGISFKAAYRIGRVLEVAYGAMGKKSEPPMTRFVAAQLALDHYFSIEKARRLLAFDPQVDRDAVMQTCKPWLQSLAAKAR